jgi:signal transduction histidine kinase
MMVDPLHGNSEALQAKSIESTRADQARGESEQLLQQVLATMPVGVAVADRAGDIVLANAASKRIWGDMMIVSGHERWARSKGFWHDSGRRVAPAEWASVRALSQGQTSLNELIDIETFDGQRRTIQNSAAPVRDAKGSIVGAVIVNEDVTERVRAEQALRQSAECLHNLSRRLLEVQEEERRHLARELHDEFGQLLATIALHVHAARRLAGAPAQSRLDECMALLHRAGGQVRSLALELRPAMLETAGLDATLRWLAERHRQRTGAATEVAGHAIGINGAVGDSVLPRRARGVDQRRSACARAPRMDRAESNGQRRGTGGPRRWGGLRCRQDLGGWSRLRASRAVRNAGAGPDSRRQPGGRFTAGKRDTPSRPPSSRRR